MAELQAAIQALQFAYDLGFCKGYYFPSTIWNPFEACTWKATRKFLYTNVSMVY